MATVTGIDLAGGSVAADVGRTIRDARLLVGWSQRELAARAGVSQATVSRAESGAAASLEMVVVSRMFTALGLRPRLQVDDLRLDDRRRQRDGLHALVNGASARRHGRRGWLTALEAMIGSSVPYGWIDLLGFREADRALLVQETKTDIPDMGGLQRSVAFYERSARAVARGLGWDARTISVLVVVLDTEAVARRLADNRDLVARAFPAAVRATRPGSRTRPARPRRAGRSRRATRRRARQRGCARPRSDRAAPLRSTGTTPMRPRDCCGRDRGR